MSETEWLDVLRGPFGGFYGSFFSEAFERGRAAMRMDRTGKGRLIMDPSRDKGLDRNTSKL